MLESVSSPTSRYYLPAQIGFDTAENESFIVCCDLRTTPPPQGSEVPLCRRARRATHGGGRALGAANFTGLVLGCIENKFYK